MCDKQTRRLVLLVVVCCRSEDKLKSKPTTKKMGNYHNFQRIFFKCSLLTPSHHRSLQLSMSDKDDDRDMFSVKFLLFFPIFIDANSIYLTR